MLWLWLAAGCVERPLTGPWEIQTVEVYGGSYRDELVSEQQDMGLLDFYEYESSLDISDDVFGGELAKNDGADMFAYVYNCVLDWRTGVLSPTVPYTGQDSRQDFAFRFLGSSSPCAFDVIDREEEYVALHGSCSGLPVGSNLPEGYNMEIELVRIQLR